MEDDASNLQDRIKRDDDEMKLIIDVAFYLYMNPGRFSSDALDTAKEMTRAMLTWNCRTLYDCVISAVLQFFLSKSFFIVPILRDLGAVESPRDEFPPRICSNWMTAVETDGIFLLYANYRLQLNPLQSYILHFDSVHTVLDASGSVKVHFWFHESLEMDRGTGAVAHIKLNVVEKLLRENVHMMLAFYIQAQLNATFTKKLVMASVDHQDLLRNQALFATEYGINNYGTREGE